MRVRTEGNLAFNTKHAVCVEIPPGWEVREIPWLKDPDALMNLAPVGSDFPNIEVTYIGKVRNPSIEATKRFAHDWLKKQRWPMIEERTISVDNLPAYEISYLVKPPLWMFWARRRQYGCKVSIVKNYGEYLIQLASLNWARDKPVFDAVVQSFQFEVVSNR